MEIREINDRDAFDALEKPWDRLAEEVDAPIFYRHAFIRIWIESFAPHARLRILAGWDRHGDLTAALPLLEGRESIYGLYARELASTANAHSCRFDLIARQPGAAASAIFRHLRLAQGWDLLRIVDVPEGGSAFEIEDAARKAGLRTAVEPSLRSPYIVLPRTKDELLRGLHGKFKANLRRRRRRLEEMGPVAVERVEGGGDLGAKLEEGFRLEAAGWKGRKGTAITQLEGTRSFYSELARWAASEGCLSLYFLRLGYRAVAFYYGLEYRARYLLLKPCYDEAYRECSPGHILTEEVLADCIRRRVSEFDFLGPDMPWKRDWTTTVRPHASVLIFRNNAVGRSLGFAKSTAAPWVRRLVRRS